MRIPSGLGLRQKTLLRVPRYSTQVGLDNRMIHTSSYALVTQIYWIFVQNFGLSQGYQ